MKARQILKYLDLFGKNCSFYVEKTPKLYSVTGGILSILTILICISIVIFTSLDDFKRISPIVTFSLIRPDKYQKIKFGKEKIWIPWRIRDYSNNFINHTNIFYPFIYNYYSMNKSFGDGFELQVKQLNYTLCNQTSFINNSEIFYINSSLDELYCIDMDDIDIGGDWRSDYISYIKFDLYLCKEGIDYDENNPYCTKYENISNFLGKNNSLMMSLYYPIVQFKANDRINPMNIIYRERFYQISRYTNKIDRIFLQKNILIDDNGWFTNKYNEISYWGLNDFQGDSYITGDKKDIMNEGSSSRVYSFDIYIEPTINTYFRTYKKIYIIFSECIPLIYIVSFLFQLIANFCKFHTINKKFLEFLFVNAKSKSDLYEKKVKELKDLNEKSLNKIDKKIFHNNSFKKLNNLIINDKNDKLMNASNLSSQKNNIFFNKLQPPIIEKIDLKDNSLEVLNHNKPKELLSDKSMDFKDNKNVGRPTIKSHLYLNNRKDTPPPEQERLKIKRKSARKMSLCENPDIRIQSLLKAPKTEYKHLVHKELFPSRYYFYAIFIKNLDVLNKTRCVSKKFSRSYMFLTRLLDIFSYFDLARQFNVFKTYLLNEKNLDFIERTKKINIGEISFMKNMKECFENNNFRIFGRMNDKS